MKLLLINTCGAEGSFALTDTGQPEATRLVTMPGRSASERLVAELRLAMLAAEWKVADVDAIAVVTGPGSFTGVRVGLSVAKGLCEASGARMIAVSRLELLAAGGAGTVCALLDAGRGEFYCGEYRDGEALGESLISLERAVEAAREADAVVFCEDAVERALSERISEQQIAGTRLPEPSAADALAIALRRFEAGEFADAATLDANYLRRTDAEIFANPPRRG